MPAALRQEVEALSAIHRPSASEGEREAAEWVSGRFAELGLEARVEVERAQGGYWLPLGLAQALAGAGALAALRGRRALGAALATVAAAAAWDDITAGRRVLRSLLPRRDTYNVIAQLGPDDAAHTIVLIAHHDAAHSALIFHPELPRAPLRRFPGLLEYSNTTPPAMWPMIGAPALVGAGAVLGSRALVKAGLGLVGILEAIMLDVAARETVPGANDNATGVATLFGVARALGGEPPPGTRVIFLSTGSEESLMEGMHGFARRHFDSLPRESTFFLCVDTVGSPRLLCLEGEGMLRMREYPKDDIRLLRAAAGDLGIEIYPELRFRNATDGLLPLQAGYRALMLGSGDEFKIPTNYHWPTDTADRVDYGTVEQAVRLATEVVRRVAAGWGGAR